MASRACAWHARLAHALRAEDAILSFNYDCLIDRALAREAPRRWRAADGYGFPIERGTDQWESPPGPGAAYKNPILLLKPHGSLNWEISDDRDEVELVEPYGPQTAHSVVPPTWEKSDVGQWPWKPVWRAARQVLAQARMLVVVGYSVPLTDQLSQSLLRADVAKLSYLVVVNPDRGARDRVVSLFASALGPQSTIHHLQDMRLFAMHLPASKSEQKQSELEARLDAAEARLDELSLESSTELDEVRDTLDRLTEAAEDFEDRFASTDSDARVLLDRLADLDARLDSVAASLDPR